MIEMTAIKHYAPLDRWVIVTNIRKWETGQRFQVDCDAWNGAGWSHINTAMVFETQNDATEYERQNYTKIIDSRPKGQSIPSLSFIARNQ
jgi:hypothetical protein